MLPSCRTQKVVFFVANIGGSQSPIGIVIGSTGAMPSKVPLRKRSLWSKAAVRTIFSIGFINTESSRAPLQRPERSSIGVFPARPIQCLECVILTTRVGRAAKVHVHKE